MLLAGEQANLVEYSHAQGFDSSTDEALRMAELDEEYSHAQGFDSSTDVGCPVKPGVHGSSGNKACCGAYPNRFPYKTLDGDRDCCGSRTYNTQILNCCPNGQVKASC